MKILDWRNLGHKGPADPAQAPPLKGQSIGLALSPAPLLQLQGCLATLRSCPCTWAKLGKPLQETECLASHYHHTCCSPCVTHDLAKHTLSFTFPASSSSQGSAPGFCKQAEEVVEVGRNITPGPCNQASLVNSPQ